MHRPVKRYEGFNSLIIIWANIHVLGIHLTHYEHTRIKHICIYLYCSYTLTRMQQIDFSFFDLKFNGLRQEKIFTSRNVRGSVGLYLIDCNDVTIAYNYPVARPSWLSCIFQVFLSVINLPWWRQRNINKKCKDWNSHKEGRPYNTYLQSAGTACEVHVVCTGSQSKRKPIYSWKFFSVTCIQLIYIKIMYFLYKLALKTSIL